MRAGAWAEANQLFEEWADRPEQELGPFLASLQSTDPLLAQLVADLLEADRTGEQIDCIDMTSVLAWLETEDGPDPWLGQQLGPYRIDSLLGAGGMGSVYLAHHENYQGPAAVKILSDSLSPERRLRFEYEKRHLGRLSHPAIARIFHADVHTDGTLFSRWST